MWATCKFSSTPILKKEILNFNNAFHIKTESSPLIRDVSYTWKDMKLLSQRIINCCTLNIAIGHPPWISPINATLAGHTQACPLIPTSVIASYFFLRYSFFLRKETFFLSFLGWPLISAFSPKYWSVLVPYSSVFSSKHHFYYPCSLGWFRNFTTSSTVLTLANSQTALET